MKNTLNRLVMVLAVVLIAAAGYLMITGTTLVPRGAQATPALFNEDTVTGIYDAASPAVVEIMIVSSETSIFGRSLQSSQGSGFLVDGDGNIVTNNHVVDGATGVKVLLNNGKLVDGTVAGTDKTSDLAVVKVDSSAVSGITPLQFADSDLLKRGQMAIALGSPYGMAGTITVGIVSGLNRSVRGSSLTGMVQTDAAINPGNSGGPLLDSSGRVIGMNTAIEATPGAQGIGYAVSSNVISKQLPDLIAGKHVTRPWVGISGVPLNEKVAGDLGIPVNKGIYIVTVVPDSPAEKAGLRGGGSNSLGDPQKGGDVITRADDVSVASVQELSYYLTSHKRSGETVTLTVVRDGSDISVTVVLGTWPEAPARSAVPLPDGHPSIPGK